MPFQICKNLCKILNNLIFNQEKLKMCKFPLSGCFQAVCLSPVLGLKGGLWVCMKSQKISTASDQQFLSYVKKTTGGGQIGPPPSRNRVK